jgi:hypothetical protein
MIHNIDERFNEQNKDKGKKKGKGKITWEDANLRRSVGEND